MLLPKKINKQIEKIFIEKLKDMCNPSMDLEDIREKASQIDISEEMDMAMKEEVAKLGKRITKSLGKILYNEHKKVNKFVVNHYYKWGECLNLFELFYILTLKFTARYCQRVNCINDGTKKQYAYEYLAIQELHGRACQIYAEIFCLIENGFADGAYARWRTIYEIMVIVDFIKSNGEVAAKAFYDSSFFDTQHCNWAKELDCFKDFKNVSFRAIEKTCNFDKGWMKEYQSACKAVHASPEGTFGRISNRENDIHFIPVGRCDYGINIPATHACIALSIINAEFLTIFPNFNTLVELRMLLYLKNAVIHSFEETEPQIFDNKTTQKITKINPYLN